jgi:hypothetical protein
VADWKDEPAPKEQDQYCGSRRQRQEQGCGQKSIEDENRVDCQKLDRPLGRDDAPLSAGINGFLTDINATQIAGIVAFSAAASTSFAAAWAVPRTRILWAALGALYALAAVEVVADWRHRLSVDVGNLLRSAGAYADRRLPQALLIILVVLLMLLLARSIARRRGRRSWLAIAAAAATAILFLIEAVSLHWLDLAVYHRAGPLMIIGWLWLLSGFAACAAAAASFSRRR